MTGRRVTFALPPLKRRAAPAAPGASGRLRLARAAWLVVALLTVGLRVVAAPLHLAQLRTICTSAPCASWQLTPEGAQALQARGLSIDVYAAYFVGLVTLFALVHLAIAGAIVWRRSDDGLALFVALWLVTFGAATNFWFGGYISPALVPLAAVHPALDLASRSLSALGVATGILFLIIFPDGRFVPRWLGWLAPVGVAWGVLATFLPGSALDPETWPSPLAPLFFGGLLSSLVFAQVYRYRRVSGPPQRQQTKWVVFGVVVSQVISNGLLVLYEAGDRSFGPNGSPAEIAGHTAAYLAWLLIPLSMGIAILRARLFDIDLIINRVLVYGALTGVLAAVYVSLVVALQQGFRTLTGQGSDLAVVASTLAIAALFQPLRARVQAVIDRRFYRHKYDAARTLAAFGARLRDEVDLTVLTGDLVSVVEQTMQPAHVSLWLRPDGEPPAPTRTAPPIDADREKRPLGRL